MPPCHRSFRALPIHLPSELEWCLWQSTLNLSVQEHERNSVANRQEYPRWSGRLLPVYQLQSPEYAAYSAQNKGDRLAQQSLQHRGSQRTRQYILNLADGAKV